MRVPTARLCLSCGAQNAEPFLGIGYCDTCRVRLTRSTSPSVVRSLTETSLWQRHSGAIVWVAVVLALLAAVSLGNRSNDAYSTAEYTPPYVASPPSATYPETVPAPAAPPLFNEPIIPIATGEIRYVGPKPRVAPLEIKAPYGTSYYVKLVHAETGSTHMIGFVGGGSTLEVLMPLGEYEMKYAVGATWYGEQYLFGPNTAYARADAPFYFTKEHDGYSGYTVELYMQPGGNLETQPILASAF